MLIEAPMAPSRKSWRSSGHCILHLRPVPILVGVGVTEKTLISIAAFISFIRHWCSFSFLRSATCRTVFCIAKVKTVKDMIMIFQGVGIGGKDQNNFTHSSFQNLPSLDVFCLCSPQMARAPSPYLASLVKKLAALQNICRFHVNPRVEQRSLSGAVKTLRARRRECKVALSKWRLSNHIY